MANPKSVPYVKQNASGGLYYKGKWSYQGIPNTQIGRKGSRIYRIQGSGCGLCSTAMALYFCTGKFTHPSEFRGKYNPGAGSSRDIGMYYGKKQGVKVEATNDWDKVDAALKKGAVVMVIMGKSAFTKGGHYIIITGKVGDRYTVNDPASKKRSYIFTKKTWSKNSIHKYSKKYSPKDKNGNVIFAAYTIFWPILKLPTATVKKGGSGENVRRVQQILTYLGLYSGEIDSSCGAKTEAAIKAFQKKYSLGIDGAFGPVCRMKAKELIKQ